MHPRPATLLVALLAAACPTPRPDAARLVGPAGMLGDDVLAIDQAEWAFASAARTRNDPADAARAVAALDYLAGNLSVSPRWVAVSLITKRQMLEARAETRAALGIAPDAPSQFVVDRMMQAADALTVNDVPAALAILATPAFTRGPERTLAGAGGHALPPHRQYRDAVCLRRDGPRWQKQPLIDGFQQASSVAAALGCERPPSLG